MNYVYELLKRITEETNIELNLGEERLIELVTDFNEGFYCKDKEYERLVKEGSNEFEFVKHQMPIGIKPVNIKINEGITYRIKLSKKGCTLATKNSLEMELEEYQRITRRNNINPELITLHTRGVFNQVANLIDQGQFRKIA